MSKYNPTDYLTLHGNVRSFVLLYMRSEGITVVGPFTNPDFVPTWAKRMGLKDDQYWLSYLYHPMD